MGLYFRGQNVSSAYFVMRSINFLSTTEKLVDKICSKQQRETLKEVKTLTREHAYQHFRS